MIYHTPQQKRIPNLRLFFFLAEETTVHFRLQPKHVGKTSGLIGRGRQLPLSFALAEPKVRLGKRKGLVCSPLLLPVFCL
jgi:hypothetical protein